MCLTSLAIDPHEKIEGKESQFSLQLSAIFSLFSEALKILMYIIMMYMILHTYFCRTKGKFGRRYGLETSFFVKEFGSFNGIFFMAIIEIAILNFHTHYYRSLT